MSSLLKIEKKNKKTFTVILKLNFLNFFIWFSLPVQAFGVYVVVLSKFTAESLLQEVSTFLRLQRVQAYLSYIIYKCFIILSFYFFINKNLHQRFRRPVAS